MSSPTGQQLRFDSKTQSYYALDAQTGRWVPAPPPNPSNQPRTTPLSPGRLPATQADVAPRSPPSASNSSYITASPDAIATAAQLQGLNIGSRARGSNQSVTAAGAPLPTRPALDPDYKVRDQPRRYFKFGKVFKALWTEPEGQSKRGQSSRFSRNQDVYRVAFGQTVFSKVRRFIVLREGDQSCTCLAISTHSGHGATQRSPFEHGIVFTGAQPPPPLSQSETQMQPIPVRIDVDQRSDALDRASRVHYGKLYTIEHNFKVKPFGMVNPGSIQAFSNQFNIVWARMTSQTPHASPLPTIQQGQPLSHPVGSPSGSNTQGLSSLESLRRSGFSDNQIKAIRTIVDRGMNPRYAIARVRAEASKATSTQAHEVGRLVVGGMDYASAFAQVVQKEADDAQEGGADDDDDDDDEDEDDDEEEEDEEDSSEEEAEAPRRKVK